MTNGNQRQVNRMYKSTLFAMLFEDKNNLLELYNAMSKKHYTDPELLEINTLEKAIYMSMKNDVSFLIDDRLSLYEHQSTYSPNLPLRFFFYVSSLYSGMTREDNLYGARAVKISPPEFIIFYNGEEERPEREILKLSDLYSIKDENINLELRAVMLNIRGTHNAALKKACRTLREYAVFTDKMREYVKTQSIEEAADRTIGECIREDILKDFLEKHKAEVKKVSIFEYDQEKHIKMEREEAWAEGRVAGVAEGRAVGIEEGRKLALIEQVRKKLEKGKSLVQIAEELEEEEAVIAAVVEKELSGH